MKLKNLLGCLVPVLLAFLVVPRTGRAQMVQKNYNGIGSMYATTPGQTEIGFAPPGYTGGVAQTAGAIGEAIASVIPSGSSVSVTTATPVNITSIALTPGVWELSWTAFIQPAASTNVTIMQAGVGTTTGTLPLTTLTTDLPLGSIVQAAAVPGSGTIPISLTSGTIRVNITANTTYYLVTSDTFTVSTLTAYGWIAGRRMR